MSDMTYDEMAYGELIDACEEKDARIKELEADLKQAYAARDMYRRELVEGRKRTEPF